MNVSMMDGFNLGWKLAYELLGLAPKGSLIPTYEVPTSNSHTSCQY